LPVANRQWRVIAKSIPDEALFESSLKVEERDLERTDPAELADLDCFERQKKSIRCKLQSVLTGKRTAESV